MSPAEEEDAFRVAIFFVGLMYGAWIGLFIGWLGW